MTPIHNSSTRASSLRRCALTLAGAFGLSAMAAQPPVGQWDFNAGNLSATTGSPLTYIDGAGGATETNTRFGTTTTLGIPDIGGTPAAVMGFPANAAGGGLNMPAPADPNGEGGTLVNNWTIIMDLLFPAESMNKLRALIDTDAGLFAPDAEFFVGANNGIGVNGSFHGAVKANTWHRIAIVHSDGFLTKYIDGVRVGRQSAGGLDGRFALTPAGNVALFTDDDGQTAAGYANSIQLRSEALDRGQINALGGPTAAGIPAAIPPVPSYVERWIPRAAYASLTTDLGLVVNLGDATVADNTVSMTLDGSAITGLTLTRANGQLTIAKPAQGPFGPGSTHTLVVNYTDSIAGAKSFTHNFTSAVFFEDFEGLELGPSVEEDVPANGVWTKTAPSGWVADDTGVPGAGDPTLDGKTEWAGFSFADKEWWALTAGDQERSKFNSASGIVMIADPDEWDDSGHEPGMFNTYITTPEISLTGVPANTAFIRFQSSWRPECCDDNAELDNSQTAVVLVSYNGGDFTEVWKYDSTPGSPFFHPDDVDQTVLVRLSNPANATKMQVKFGLILSENDWWWAVDDILVQAGAEPPGITQHPMSQYVSEGANITLNVTATGTAPLTYRWQKNGADVPNANGTSLTFNSIGLTASGSYQVIVQNPGGTATSQVARVEVSNPSSILQDLVAHLKFDNNLDDSSGHNNAGTAVGAPGFSAGQVGANAMHIGSTDDYVSLGAPADLNFGTDTDFSVSIWVKMTAWSDDPSIIGNKDWDSGSNPGYVISTDNDGHLQWNWAGKADGSNGDRKDYDGPAGTFSAPPTWRHVVVAVDRQGMAVTYVDGVQRDARNISTPPNQLNTLDGLATNIGQDGAGDYGPRFSDADFDDLGIWRRVVTAQEVANIFNKGKEGKDLSTASFVKQLTTPLDQDLVLYLPFDNSLSDASGSGHNGASIGSTSFSAGKVGAGALHIGDAAGYVTVGNPADLNFGSDVDFSIAFWAKTTTWTEDPAFIANKDWDSGSNIGWVISTDGDGHLQWNLAGKPDGSRGDRKDYDGPAGLFTGGNWRHVVLSYDRQGNAVTYVDGAQVDSRAVSTPPNKPDTLPGLAINIGQDGAGDYGPKFTNADIDEVAIWRRALIAEDVATIYGSAGGIGSLLTKPRITGAAVNGANLVINVAGAKAGAKLQKRANLDAGTQWQDVADVTGASVSVPISGATGFFRVSNP